MHLKIGCPWSAYVIPWSSYCQVSIEEEETIPTLSTVAIRVRVVG